MQRRWPHPDSRRRSWRRRGTAWWIVAALAALTPKCALCLLAYTGLGAWFGLVRPEWCGAGPPDRLALLTTAAAWCGATALLLVAGRCCLPGHRLRAKPR